MSTAGDEGRGRAGGTGRGPGSGKAGPGEPFRLLFVCTGNTCRSPLAEAIARRTVVELGWEHVEVRSAGVAAPGGEAASPGSVLAAERHGLDLSGHRSTPVTPEVVDWADMILAMSASHLRALQAMGAGGKAAVITEFAEGREGEGGTDPDAGVRDPLGGGIEEYEATFRQLDDLVPRSLARLAPLVAP